MAGKSLGYVEIISRINARLLEENMVCLSINWKNGKINTNCSLRLVCLACGLESVKTYNNFVSMRQGCKSCKYAKNAIKQALDETFVINDINYRLRENKLVFERFEGNKYVSKKKTKVHVRCLTCGKITVSTYAEIYRRGLYCRFCHNKEYSDEELIPIIDKACEYNSLSFIRFDDGRLKSFVRCNVCEREFSIYTHYLINNGGRCKFCHSPSKMEREVMDRLTKLGIEFIYQAKSRHLSWLGRLSLDFYIPSLRVAIECQGKQHFCRTKYSDRFDIIKERDDRKRRLCLDNGVRLLYYSDVNYCPDLFLGEPVYKSSEAIIKAALGLF